MVDYKFLRYINLYSFKCFENYIFHNVVLVLLITSHFPRTYPYHHDKLWFETQTQIRMGRFGLPLTWISTKNLQNLNLECENKIYIDFKFWDRSAFQGKEWIDYFDTSAELLLISSTTTGWKATSISVEFEMRT